MSKGDDGTPSAASSIASVGLTCPAPAGEADRVLLGHGSGGKLSAALLRERFLPGFGNEILEELGDAAVVRVGPDEMAVSTDSFAAVQADRAIRVPRCFSSRWRTI